MRERDVKRKYKVSIAKFFSAVLLMLCCTVSLCSCLGATSLEKYGYVLTVGIDKGEVYKYRVSFLLESQISESEQNQSSRINVVSSEGDSIYETIYAAETGLPYRLNFSRTNYIIIGYDIAADGEIMDFFSTSWSMLKIRTSANLVVANCTATEFIEGLNYTNEINITKLENSLIDFYETEGLTSMLSITEFMSAVSSTRYDAVVPLGSIDKSVEDSTQSDTTEGFPRKGGMVSYILGAALFANENMCGVISGRETQLLLLMQGKLDSAAAQFTRDDKTNYTVLIGNSGMPKVDIELDGENIKAHFDIKLSVTLAQDSSFEMLEKMKNKGDLDESMHRQICNYIKGSCKKLSEDFRKLGCDAIGIGKHVSMKFTTVKDWESYDFKSHIPYIECDFNVKIDIEDIYISTYIE